MPRSGRLILGADSPEAARLASLARCEVETFGLETEADWRASAVRPSGDVMTFDLTHRGERLGPVSVPLFGGHNVRNALAALAVGHAAGLGVGEMVAALSGFRGVRRRLELRGTRRHVTVFDDFAHHPTAILETLRAVRWSYPGSARLGDLRTALRDLVPARLPGRLRAGVRGVRRGRGDPRVRLPRLIARGGAPVRRRPRQSPHLRKASAPGTSRTVPEIVATVVDEARDGDLVVVMSNGGFDNIHDKLLAALAAGER